MVVKLSSQDQTGFFRQVNPFRRCVAFCETGSEAKVIFLNPFQPQLAACVAQWS